jgi:hypothetical protein
MAEKSSLDQANRRENMVWFGEIERKLAKLSKTILLTVLPINYFMPPTLLRFLFGWSSFAGSESGQIKSIKLLQNMVPNSSQHSPIHKATLPYVNNVLYFDTGKGEGGES